MFEGARSCRAVSWLLFLAALLAMFPFYVVMKIIRLMAKLETVISEMGEGNLSVRLAEDSNDDELSRVAASLNRSLCSLASAMLSVRCEAGSLVQSADELNGISEEMAINSGNSERQASEVSESAQGIAAGIGGVAQAARTMVVSIEEALRSTADAHRMAGETDRTARQASEMTEQLRRVTHDIGNVADVVKTVAHQTNLLGLNAAIEAARVGQDGRGFAVVAHEIRALSAETSRAVKQIQASIQSARSFTAQVAKQMEIVSTQAAQMNSISTDIARLVVVQSDSAKCIERNATVVSSESLLIAEAMNSALESARSASERGSKTQEAASRLRIMARTVGDSMGRFELESAGSEAPNLTATT
jgi:methyl-accepting chemotaxis protein